MTRNPLLKSACLGLLAGATALSAVAQSAAIKVDAAHPGAAIASTMFGIFFEDINFAADGGIYPELVKNRSFEFTDPLYSWKADYAMDPKGGLGENLGEFLVGTEKPINASNPHYMTIHAYKAGYAVHNPGFRGMGITSGAQYRFSVWVRSKGPKSIKGEIQDHTGKVIGSATIHALPGEWKRLETTITATATDAHGAFRLVLDEPGSVDVDMVSLFPTDTFKGRPNGLRKDLTQMLADLHPGFIRFPGGCIVEGRSLANRYRWKKTIGDVSERTTIINRWNTEFDYRPAPDYFQSYGLGFYEYFQLAEDIGASPLPILNCGMACEFNTNEMARGEDVKEYIQDALDLVEFANGAVTTPWGGMRAKLGHPEPFNLKMIGVGNEQWGSQYPERYKLFADALKAKYPEIQLVVSAGPSPDGGQFTDLWAEWKKQHADVVDEHYYMDPKWFLDHADRYDKYDRNGPKVFAGEYAAQSEGQANNDNHNNWQTALSEAAFMTGLERNADVVRMASYAPLFAHVDAWQWKPDLIWFDNLRVMGTPNYYVQKLFANNVGTRILPVNAKPADGVFVSASLDEKSHEIIVKAVNTTAAASKSSIELAGVKVGATVRTTQLASTNLKLENSLDEPTKIQPVAGSFAATSNTIPVELPADSLTVFRIPMN